MNKIRLDSLKVEVQDPYLRSHDVIVDFEYEKLNYGEVKFFLEVYLGENQEHYCFHFKAIFLIYLQQDFVNEDELLDQVIPLLIEPLMTLIIAIDNAIDQSEERLN